MNEIEETEFSVRKEIRKHLSKCDPVHTPKICELIKTQEGYRKVESNIILIIIQEKITIGAAIAQYEMELL